MNRRIESFPAKLLRTFLLRGVTLWLMARLMGMAFLGPISPAAPTGAVLSIWVVVMTASLTLVDLHRRRELTLLHNLGITTARTVVLGTVPAILAETLLVMLIP